MDLSQGSFLRSITLLQLCFKLFNKLRAGHAAVFYEIETSSVSWFMSRMNITSRIILIPVKLSTAKNKCSPKKFGLLQEISHWGNLPHL